MSFLQCDIQFFNNLRFVQQFPINAFTLTFPRARILDWISKLGGSMIQFSSGSDAFLLLSWWKVRFPQDIGFDMICLCSRHFIFLFWSMKTCYGIGHSSGHERRFISYFSITTYSFPWDETQSLLFRIFGLPIWFSLLVLYIHGQISSDAVMEDTNSRTSFLSFLSSNLLWHFTRKE